MASAVTTQQQSGTAIIGEMAGKIWHYLEDSGPVPLTKLVSDIEAPRDLVMQAVGWLARENKVNIEAGPRTKTISLC